MAKKYPSKYSNGKSVSAAQYITELICEHKAKIDKKDLHYRFWVNKEWAAFYRNQIATANKLVKKYDPSAIIKAINNKRSERTYSLRSPYLIKIIDQEQKKINSKPAEQQTTSYDRNVDSSKRRKSNSKKNILSRLEEIDHEQD